jgi:hypothetical protein
MYCSIKPNVLFRVTAAKLKTHSKIARVNEPLSTDLGGHFFALMLNLHVFRQVRLAHPLAADGTVNLGLVDIADVLVEIAAPAPSL